MRTATRSEIERIFNNRRDEACPFRSNGAGLEWFARMLPLADELTADEIRTFLLPLLELLLAKTDCFGCRAKGLVFAELLCSAKAPASASSYREQYKRHMLNVRADAAPRDYRADVHAAIKRYGAAGGWR